MAQREARATPRLPQRRRNDILSLVEKNGHVNVSELTDMFRASDDTIRRDLDALAAQGKLKRAHGGAVSLEWENTDHKPIGDRQFANVPAKTRIARQVADLISTGERLFINGGTTTLCVAKELVSLSRLTILTNNLLVPAVMEEGTSWDLYVLGGRYHAGSQVTTKTEGLDFMTAVTTDTAIIGIGGVSVESGFTVSLFEDAAAIEQMITRARRLIVVADSSKFGKDHLVPVATRGRETILVTDEMPEAGLSEWLATNSIELLVARER